MFSATVLAVQLLHVAAVSPAALRLRAAAQSLRSGRLTEAEPVPSLSLLQTAEDARNVTSFPTLLSACRACVEFYPAKEDGEKFHAPMFEDPVHGGSWPQVCRAVPCTTRGDIVLVGTSVESNEEAFCITKVPVSWATDCEPLIQASMESLYDVTRYCSYREQIFVPPPAESLSAFTGVSQAFTRLDGSLEQCQETIRVQGMNLWDPMSVCDSDIQALSRCCESVHNSMKCVLEVGSAEPAYLFQKDARGQEALTHSASEGMDLFRRYCVPLCEYNREEYCQKYPHADVCVTVEGCPDCTSKGGQWCPITETCTCPQSEISCARPFARTGAECLTRSTTKFGYTTTTTTTTTAVATSSTSYSPLEAPPCKYLEMADAWSQQKMELHR